MTAAPSAAACQLSAQPAPEVTWPPLIPGITLGRAQAGGYENIPATPTLIGAAKSLGKHQGGNNNGTNPSRGVSRHAHTGGDIWTEISSNGAIIGIKGFDVIVCQRVAFSIPLAGSPSILTTKYLTNL